MNSDTSFSPKKMYVQFHAVPETTDEDESPVLYGVTVEYPQIEKDKELITDFKVYPTISTGSTKIAFRINDFIKEIKDEIKESSGKTVREIDVPDTPGTHQTEVNTSMPANGVYFLKISAYSTDSAKTAQVKKFMVKK